PVGGLGDRYARIREELDRAGLPCFVGFSYLDDGIRVGEGRYPVVKMDWVEGMPLNEVAAEHAGSPGVIDNLLRGWVRLSRQLREAGVSHGDLEHGNILIVSGARPGTFGFKLVDYDGIYVPALAGASSEESGHVNYQHPARASDLTLSPDVDRFPVLVIATALKGLAVLGRGLWVK